MSSILLLCRNDATLLITDKVFKLLLQDLRDVDSELASMLRTNLRSELCKRRTVLSTVLAVLTIPKYNVEYERQIEAARAKYRRNDGSVIGNNRLRCAPISAQRR